MLRGKQLPPIHAPIREVHPAPDAGDDLRVKNRSGGGLVRGGGRRDCASSDPVGAFDGMLGCRACVVVVVVVVVSLEDSVMAERHCGALGVGWFANTGGLAREFIGCLAGWHVDDTMSVFSNEGWLG